MLRKIAIGALLCFSLTASALAVEVPTEIITQNVNGNQQCVKTFSVPPDTDPETLIEKPFTLDGFTYTYASMTKQENRLDKEEEHTESVTVETGSKDMSAVLKALEPSMEYDDGQYKGTLHLDHDTIKTEAAGYVWKSYTVSDSKTYDGLPSNDMSSIAPTTVKDGVTLKLAGVDWQVQSTALVDDVLVPAQYRAVASYSGTASYKAATGYITTAEYTGTISCSGLESVTYTITYSGALPEASPEPEPSIIPEPPKINPAPEDKSDGKGGDGPELVQTILCIAAPVLLLLSLVLLLLLIRSQRQLNSLRSEAYSEYYDETEEPQ